MVNIPAVKVCGLCKVFDDREIIKNCSLTVERGTIYGFLGVNGAGKTTVFKLLTGLLTPTMGDIQILGMKAATHNIEILKSIGSLIETPIFYEHLSAAENLQIHLAYMRKENADIDGTLSMVGLANTGEQPVSKFSLGMRQRLAIARSIIHKPQLLILDEPINGLDPIGIQEMRKLFVNLVKKHNMTIMISSHILTEIGHIADTIGVIVNGSIIQEVPMQEIKLLYPDLEDFFIDIMRGGKDNAQTDFS